VGGARGKDPHLLSIEAPVKDRSHGFCLVQVVYDGKEPFLIKLIHKTCLRGEEIYAGDLPSAFKIEVLLPAPELSPDHPDRVDLKWFCASIEASHAHWLLINENEMVALYLVSALSACEQSFFHIQPRCEAQGVIYLNASPIAYWCMCKREITQTLFKKPEVGECIGLRDPYAFGVMLFLDHSMSSSNEVPFGKNFITPISRNEEMSASSKTPPAVTVI
jgi:hypothetical protein